MSSDARPHHQRRGGTDGDSRRLQAMDFGGRSSPGGGWECKIAPCCGVSVTRASRTATLQMAGGTKTLAAQLIEHALAQPFSTLSQQGSGLAGAACRSTAVPSMDAMLEAAGWDASMPHSIRAAEAVIGLAARARRARMAIRKRAITQLSALSAAPSRRFVPWRVRSRGIGSGAGETGERCLRKVRRALARDGENVLISEMTEGVSSGGLVEGGET